MPIGVGPNRIRARAAIGGLVAIAPLQSIRTSPAIADGLLMRWSSDITRTTAYCTQRERATASLLRFGSDCSRDFGTPKPPSAPLRIFQSLAGGRWGQGLTAAKMEECRWLRPELVAQFKFVEWTPDPHLRHSHYGGQRRGMCGGRNWIENEVYLRASRETWRDIFTSK